MALNIREVYTAVKTQLSVAGLTVCDLDGIPTTDQARRQPILYPEPARTLVNVGVQDDSYGAGGSRRMTASYTLMYTLLYREAGTGRDIADNIPGLVSLIADILDAFLLLDSLGIDAVVDWNMTSTVTGYIQDAAGVLFHGATLQIVVRELIN